MTTSQSPLAIDPVVQQRIQQWLQGNYDDATKSMIQKQLKENPQALIDSFYTNLSFGTGGMRGVMGVGTNRFNVYTVRAATQGIANYINKQPSPPQGRRMVIGYDSRHHSKTFAEEAAKVLAANGITVYLFKKLRPTPLISFACRELQCTSAIMITASHNPPEYNGYKVYWNDGAQVLPPHDKGIIAEVNAITDLTDVKVAPIDSPYIHWLGDEMDSRFIAEGAALQHYAQINQQHGTELSLVYTPLHGTGITMVPQALARWGFHSITIVKEQQEPDGNFPTTPSPNPEERAALNLGIITLMRINGDLLIATDPDADRMGIAVNHHHEAILLNGHQIACLCVNHICKALKEQKRMPIHAAFIKSVVTTDLFRAIVEGYGQTCIDVLTGFKYVAEKIRQWEQDPNGPQFIFGGEESYGYQLGTFVRDKDAVTVSALIAEAALQAKLQGKTLIDELNEIYRRHGIYREVLLSIKYEETKAGKDQMQEAMKRLRANPPQALEGTAVTAVDDYLIAGGDGQFPKTDMLIFRLADGSKVVVRPSGTEPKVKLYGSAIESEFTSVEEGVKRCDARINSYLVALRKLL